MELLIKPLQELKPIDFNFEELKKELAKQLEKYKGLAFTEEMVVEAKESRATLNKLSKAINDRKISIKTEFMVPYTEFETKIKELLSMIEKPVLEIDSQIKKFEEEKKNRKLDEIRSLYDEFIEGNEFFVTFIKFEDVMNSLWLNAAFSMKKIAEELTVKVERITNDIDAIRLLGSEYEVPLMDLYRRSFDLSVVLTAKSNMDKIKASQEVKHTEQPKAKETRPEPAEQDDVSIIDFRVHVNTQQRIALRDFLVGNKIRYEKL